ncbi:MAG: DUF86 domain-containing protein [Desulfohalobiaceae bacterium]|nr:DUF86 domain-containing protein [Desulfohalobiaceae bacterium]
MPIDKERLKLYLDQIRAETEDLEEILNQSDEIILAQSHYLKSLKYSIIIIAEAMGSTLQHILARKHNISIYGFSEAFNKSKNKSLISPSLLNRLLPFIRFRNLLVHQYWKIDDQRFLEQLRKGRQDFADFITEISSHLKTD